MPFIPGYSYAGNLDNMTLSLNGTHPLTNYTVYDVHSLYGDRMCYNTFNYLIYDNRSALAGTRTFILSRSTFVGSGRYTSHWTGDNFRYWEFMVYSIAGIMNFNMFGIP